LRIISRRLLINLSEILDLNIQMYNLSLSTCSRKMYNSSAEGGGFSSTWSAMANSKPVFSITYSTVTPGWVASSSMRLLSRW